MLARPGYIGGRAGGRSTDPSHRDHQMRDIEDGASTGGSDPLLPASKCTHFQPIFSHYCIFCPPLPLSPPELQHLFLIAHSQSLHCQDLPCNRSASDCIQHNICFADSEPSPSQPGTRRTNCADCANGEGMATSNIAKLKRL